jgi:glycine betaine/choline ABC-type transport system substrate-binding protein
MRLKPKTLAIVFLALLALGAAAGLGLWSMSVRAHVVVGAKNFTESRVLAEIMAQIIEKQTGLTVDRRELGSTGLCYDGLNSGALHLYPEYSGTLLTDILKESPIADPVKAMEKVRTRLEQYGTLQALEPFGLNDTYVLSMRADEAKSRGIVQISDLQKHPDLKAGFTSEFNQRPDGYPGLAKHYGLKFNSAPVNLAPGHMYGAVVDKHVQLISAFSTDARIQKFDLVRLEDDQQFFPAYQAVPLLRADFAKKYPGVMTALATLAGKIDDTTMLSLNFQVDVVGIPVKEVARRFLELLSSR